MASIYRGSSAEIWCGESHGSVSVFTLTEGVVTSQEVLNHHDPVVENAEVLQIVGAKNSPSGAKSGNPKLVNNCVVATITNTFIKEIQSGLSIRTKRVLLSVWFSVPEKGGLGIRTRGVLVSVLYR